MKIRFLSCLLFSFNVLLIGQKMPLNPAYNPFYHGIASGDPLKDRVIIWTRITPDTQKLITGSYVVATDTALQSIVATGIFSTDSNKDFTVKIDVSGLQPNTTYYYAFYALGKRSFIGRTKTTPSVMEEDSNAGSDNSDTVLKLAIASCANYEDGYFNAYTAIAARNDLNAVIHLGDYYYEYAAGAHRNLKLDDPKRNYIPRHKLYSKADYRLRLALYRLDSDLQRLHQQHPLIMIWDDHEIANNAYESGAKKHDPKKADWFARKHAAKEAYLEWMPVREGADNTVLYRSFSYGKLLDLIMLDTRLDGREKQPREFDEPEDTIYPRHMISRKQYDWLINHLKHSKARWKVVGSQVVFSDINLGFAAFLPRSRSLIRIFQNLFLDTWHGYKRQRSGILDSIQIHKINNVVIVSGDSHNAWAFDLNKMPVIYPVTKPKFSYLPHANPYNPETGEGYNPETGEGSLGVEFSTPSVTSASFSEVLTPSMISHWETKGNAPHPGIKGNPNYNPHLKYINLNKHGYFVLDIRADSVQCDYFYVPTVIKRTSTDYWGRGLSTLFNSNRITNAATLKPAPPKAVQDTPAPVPRVTSDIIFKNN